MNRITASRMLHTLARVVSIVGAMVVWVSSVIGCSPESSSPRLSDAQLDRIERDEQDKKKVTLEKNARWVAVSAFDYVRGTIKNNSHRTVKYWKVTAQYVDGNEKVYDSDAVESRKALQPGASSRFEIKHIHTPLTKRARVDVAEVRFAD